MNDQSRTITAIILSAIVLIGWQFYFGPKHEVSPGGQVPVAQESKESTLPAQDKVQEEQALDQGVRTSYRISRGDNEFVVTNFFEVEEIKSKTSSYGFKEAVGGKERPFQLFVLSEQGYSGLNLSDVNVQGHTLEAVDKHFGIKVKLQIDESDKVQFVLSSEKNYKYKALIKSEPMIEGNVESHRSFSFLTKDLNKFNVGEAERGEGRMQWFGVDYNYHLFALVNKAPSLYNYYSTETSRFNLDLIEATNSFEGYFIFKKKNYDDLVALGDNLKLSVDFGIWGILAVPILRGLQFFYELIPNYGISIIIITILMRIITFPLQFKSFKSMKKMQQMQPEMLKIKEKYKSDPQRMQRETMELFKRSGANPLGGCLPLLLQMPVFFAFYKVLYAAVELVGAPFYGWIHDLSAKDPYFVLPILMTIVMVVQQKLQPSTSMDSTQQKIMMIMPVVFGFIMKDLPSGLVLYIFVSTLFGIFQQMFVYKFVD